MTLIIISDELCTQMHVRMTGCPNGCARPYMAEVGLVGDGPNSYQLYLGGSSNQTRLAEVYMERMKMQVRQRIHAPRAAATVSWRPPSKPLLGVVALTPRCTYTLGVEIAVALLLLALVRRFSSKLHMLATRHA